MGMNQERPCESEVHLKILDICKKIDEELADPQKTNMALVDEYLRQVKELDGSPEMTEAELEEGLQEIYRKAAARKKKNFLRRFHTAWGRAACVAAAVLIAFTCSMTVSAVRTPVVNFLTNAYDQFTEILFDDADIEKAPSTIETVYTLGYVPEGYVEKECKISKISTHMVWTNKENEKIVFKQNVLDSYITTDNEYADCEIILIDEAQIFYMTEDSVGYYYWNSNEYVFYLAVPANVTNETAINLIQTLKIKK